MLTSWTNCTEIVEKIPDLVKLLNKHKDDEITVMELLWILKFLSGEEKARIKLAEYKRDIGTIAKAFISHKTITMTCADLNKALRL